METEPPADHLEEQPPELDAGDDDHPVSGDGAAPAADRHNPEVAALASLTHVWWPAAGGLLVAALAGMLSSLQDDDPTLAAVWGIAGLAMLLTGFRVLALPAVLIAAAGGPVVFVAAEQFDDRARTAVTLAIAAGVAVWALTRIRARQAQLGDAVADLHARAERRSIRDAVQEALAQRRRDNYVEREFVRAQRYGREVTVAVAEADNLELLRRERGPEAVQEILVRLGELFASDTRLPDGGLSDDLRLVFVLPETPLLGGRVVAERVRLNFAASRLPGASGVPLTVSIGVASYPQDGEHVHDVIHAAEEALQRAVGRGGNRTMLSRSPAGTPAGWSD